VEGGHYFFTDAKSWPLIRPGMILTVGSKLLTRLGKVAAKG